MKIQIRSGVFETNSSSTHVLTLMKISTYQDWENNKLKYNPYLQDFKLNIDADTYNKDVLDRYINSNWIEDKSIEGILRCGESDVYLTYNEFFDIYLGCDDVVEDQLNDVYAISYYKYS